MSRQVWVQVDGTWHEISALDPEREQSPLYDAMADERGLDL